MPIQTLLSSSLTHDEARVQEQAAEVVETIQDHETYSVTIDVAGRQIAAGSDLSQFLVSIVSQLAHGATVGVRSLPDELTTTTAAQELGISRPTLMKLIRANEIQSHKVGSHTRVMTRDLVEYRERKQQERKAAFSALQDLELQHGITD